MNLQTIGKLMIAIGVAMVLYALTMPVSIADAEVINIHLMYERQNRLIIGGLLFIAGIVLFATFKLKQSKEEADAESEKYSQKAQNTKAGLEKVGKSTAALGEKLWRIAVAVWRDHGVARLLSALTVTYLIVSPIYPYSITHDDLEWLLLIPSILAFWNCKARTAILMVHLMNIAVNVGTWIDGFLHVGLSIDEISIFSAIHEIGAILVSITFIGYAYWRFKPSPKLD